MGELDFRILLEQYAGAGHGCEDRAALAWRRVRIVRIQAREEAAADVCGGVGYAGDGAASSWLRTVLCWRRNGSIRMIREEAQGYSGRGDTGGFHNEDRGTRVESVEGIPESR